LTRYVIYGIKAVRLDGLELYVSPSGRCPVADFLSAIRDAKLLEKTIYRLQRLDKFGYRNRGKYPRPLSGYKPLWEERVKNIRFLFFECPNGNIVLLHAFFKKQGRIAKRHLETAWDRMRSYEERKK